MSITVTKILHEDRNKDRSRSSDPINRPKQAADQLAACWSPPIPPKGDTVEITLRFAFNNRGGVVGAPRVTYVKAPKGSSAEAVREFNSRRDKDLLAAALHQEHGGERAGLPPVRPFHRAAAPGRRPRVDRDQPYSSPGFSRLKLCEPSSKANNSP